MRKTIAFITAGLLFSFCASSQTKIPLKDVPKHLGEIVTVCTKVFGSRTAEKFAATHTLLDCGATYPKQQLVISIHSADNKHFAGRSADSYIGKKVCVTGKLSDYNGTPEIVVTKPEEIHIQPVMGGGDIEIKTKDFFWFE